jgi:hypothetical protein
MAINCYNIGNNEGDRLICVCEMALVLTIERKKAKRGIDDAAKLKVQLPFSISQYFCIMELNEANSTW